MAKFIAVHTVPDKNLTLIGLDYITMIGAFTSESDETAMIGAVINHAVVGNIATTETVAEIKDLIEASEHTRAPH